MQDEYDLESVTARLEAMQARRRRWQNRANEGTGTCQLPERQVADEFDLAPADLSSGDDSDESSSTSSLPSDDDNTCTPWHRSAMNGSRPERQRARRVRVADSLDLSMSVSMPDKGPPGLLQAEATTCTSASSQSAHSKLPDEDPTRPTQKPSQQDGHDQTVGSEHRVNSIFTKTSRIPKLVQQRRKLHASTKSSDTSVSALRSELEPVSAADGDVPTGQDRHRKPPAPDDSLRGSNQSEQARPPHSTHATSRGLSMPKHSSFVTRPRAINPDDTGMPEEVDSTTEEEQRLLQSLEKLDRRLTNVSAPSAAVREGGQPSLQRERVLSSPRPRANTDGPNTVCSVNFVIDDETLRTAAYGGGTHCKLRQPSSLSVRSSSAKRAELSTGVYKARVRVGGAHVQPTDRSGKHKIVVKKELAHLLF